MYLVLLARALPDQLRAPGDPATQSAGSLVWRPDPGQKPSRKQLRECARVELVRLGGLRRALDRLRVGKHDPADMRLKDPRDRKRVSGRLEHDLIICTKAPRK